jgi:S-adenosylmethionine:tRNA ribosyltransferase-isomerase
MGPEQISIANYNYDLPQSKIALFPLEQRDQSKLLVYKNQTIADEVFENIAAHIPEKSLLIFNDTKVINARILFSKATGSTIEVFCLEPTGAFTNYETVMQATSSTTWKCLVGGAAKWQEDSLQKLVTIGGKKVLLIAKKISHAEGAYVIEFSWNDSTITFAEIIHEAGNVPLPPYLKRKADNTDENRYQTIYATHEGSVAAPTAGLHFTNAVLEKAAAKNIKKEFVTLHVGAGTFMPVKAAHMAEHQMHAEYINVTIPQIENVRKNLGKIVAVGTTSTRTLETLYWLGVKVFLNKHIKDLQLTQWEAYKPENVNAKLPAAKALDALLLWLKNNKLSQVFMQTQILIAPGYSFKIVNMLVTNFHQPKSTLLLLIAAALGDNWQQLYNHALNNNYRFLSYGDSNLIFIK